MAGRKRASAGTPAVREALAAAERRSLAAGETWTASRRRVMEMLLQASGPVKAYDLIGGYSDAQRPVSPPTVYRALEALERLGLAHRLESMNAYMACRGRAPGHAAGFLICEACGSVEEFESDQAYQRAAAEATGFALRHVTLEMRGLCPRCAG